MRTTLMFRILSVSVIILKHLPGWSAGFLEDVSQKKTVSALPPFIFLVIHTAQSVGAVCSVCDAVMTLQPIFYNIWRHEDY